MFHDPRTRSGKLPRALRICVVFVVLALSTAAPSFAQQAEPSINLRPVSKAVDSSARPLSRREIYDRALAAAVWIVTAGA